MSYSEDDDLDSYPSSHRGDGRHGRQEIDWAKLMESGDLDNDLDLNTERPLYTMYNDDGDESNVDLFLKKPTKPTPQNKTGNREKSRLSARLTSLGADSIHAISDLNVSESPDISLTSTITGSDSTARETSVAMVHEPPSSTHTGGGGGKLLREGKSLKPTGRVRDVSEVSLSDQNASGYEKVPKRGGAALQVLLPRTTVSKAVKSLSDYDEEGSSLLLSEVLSEGSELLNIGQNVFSIDQLEEAAKTRGQSPPQGGLSGAPSLSESLGAGYAANVHTVDELLADGLEDAHKEMVSKDLIKYQPSSKTKSLESVAQLSDNQTENTVIVQSTNSKEAVDTSGGPRNSGTFKFSASPQSSEQTEPAAEDGDDSYSVDEDFESVTVTKSSPESSDGHGGGGSTARDEGADVQSDGGEGRGGSHSEGVEDGGTEYQYSSFSDDVETSLNQTVSTTSVKPHPTKHKQHSSTHKQPTRHKTKQSHRDASIQTPSCLYPGPTLNHTPSLLDNGLPPPTPILPHVLTTEKLEALAAYSPQSIALNDMIKRQLALIRHSIETTRRQVTTTCESVNTNHHYTTLEETKTYIERNSPRVLTMKEAKKRFKRAKNL